MEPAEIGLVWAAAFLGAVLSGIVGMAGGMVLLAVMLVFLPPLSAIPLHGAIQFVANGTRGLLQRRHVSWPIIRWYAVLLLPGVLLGAGLTQTLPEGVGRAAIGVFVLLATWAPGALLLGAHPERVQQRRRFLLLGGVAGLLSAALGAIGPLLAPFFLGLGLPRRAVVGTKAWAQLLGHLAKIVVFGALGFAFHEHLLLLAGCVVAVVAGTWLGSRVLEGVSERNFTLLYKGVLSLVALRLVLGELYTRAAAAL